MKHYVHKAGTGLAYSATKDIRLFEDMAARGYQPVHLNIFGFYKFERCSPEEVIYAYDCSKVDQKSEEFEEYKGLFEAAGWHFVYGKDGCNFFKAPRGTAPIHTDALSESIMHKNVVKILLPSLLIPAALALLFIAVILIAGRQPWIILMWSLAGGCVGIASVMLVGVVMSLYRAYRVART